jgi:thiamine biosynthesis lipoprotein
MITDILNIENLHKYTHYAMATVYEIYIQSEDEDYSEKAAWEAFNEIDRLEEELSRFKPNSEISRINRLKCGEKLIVLLSA